jgi:hypothetical protein
MTPPTPVCLILSVTETVSLTVVLLVAVALESLVDALVDLDVASLAELLDALPAGLLPFAATLMTCAGWEYASQVALSTCDGCSFAFGM